MTNRSPASSMLAAVALSMVAATTAAQQQSPKEVASVPDNSGLPRGLLRVPGGDTWIGVSFEDLLQMNQQAVKPFNPERAEAPKVAIGLKNTASELGRTKVKVDEFYLSRDLVTNKEYKAYVEQTKTRFPYHWWRYGRKDDFEARIKDINAMFPGADKLAAIYYWEKMWKELPYDLKDEFGKPIDDLPVSNVSWYDAVRYAGWHGMRLVSETEWTRAARGDGANLWLWGTQKDSDRYTDEVLKQLGISGTRSALTKVGSVQAAFGPFGHTDMVGQLWELTGEIGFRPLGDNKAFESEYKRLQSDKTGKLMEAPELHNDRMVPVKGGSYMSGGNPIQLHIDSRVGVLPDETLDGVGFRLAKSLKPGYDMMYSLLRSGYSRHAFASDQKVLMAQQVGIERYTMGAGGMVTKYEAVSLAPVSWLVEGKNAQLAKVMDESARKPILIGTIATTVKLAEPDVAPGVYSVLFRDAGMPKELIDAIKIGNKEQAEEAKRKERNEPLTEDEKHKRDTSEWMKTLKRYGIEYDEVAQKDAHEKIKFVRMGGQQIPTDTSAFLLQNNEEQFVAVIPTRQSPRTPATKEMTSEFSLDAKGAKERVVVNLYVPFESSNPKRQIKFSLVVVLDLAPAGAENPWRMPNAASAVVDTSELSQPASGAMGKSK